MRSSVPFLTVVRPLIPAVAAVVTLPLRLLVVRLTSLTPSTAGWTDCVSDGSPSLLNDSEGDVERYGDLDMEAERDLDRGKAPEVGVRDDISRAGWRRRADGRLLLRRV